MRSKKKTALKIVQRSPLADLAGVADGAAEAECAVTLSWARQIARQRVLKSAGKLVDELVKSAEGNYLATKFLFDFAGLMSAEEEPTRSAEFEAMFQGLHEEAISLRREQTSDVKLNLSNDGDSQNCR